MTPIGINNGNFRNGDYREWASQDLSGVPTWDQLMELKKLETAYGADWEHDADALRQLLESGEDAHPAEVAYELEKAMDADGRNAVENEQIKAMFGKIPVTTGAEWRKRHLHQTDEERETARHNAEMLRSLR